MLTVALIFLIPLSWYVGVRMGFSKGAEHGRKAVLRSMAEHFNRRET